MTNCFQLILFYLQLYKLHLLNAFAFLIFEQMQAATTIARSLYALATVDSLDNALGIQAAVAGASHLVVDAELIELLMNCSVLSWNCPITKEYSPRLIDIAEGKMRGENCFFIFFNIKYLTVTDFFLFFSF